MTSDQRRLVALGFCGADDSVHPHHLVILAQAYPVVEFGVLFRPDKEGQPRYATTSWIEQLARAANMVNEHPMKLAAHLCGSRVNEVLDGDFSFVSQVEEWGFRRVQINATAVNGVDTSNLPSSVPTIRKMINQFQNLEFILQKNDETESLCQGLIEAFGDSPPVNMSLLVDESKGRGVTTSNWPNPTPGYRTGYAGGLGPVNIATKLPEIAAAAAENSFWIDMESSLRSTKNGADVFDLDKCYTVIETACTLGFMSRPLYLPSS